MPVSIHQPDEDLVADAVAVVEQPLDRVGDLELAPVRRLDRGDGLVDGRVEQVDADEREVRRRVGGLLDQAHHLAGVVDLGDAELARVVDVGEQDLGRGRVRLVGAALVLEPVDELGEALLEHVVAEVHDEVVVAEEVAGDEHAVGEPERRVLGDVGDPSRPKREPSPTAARISSPVSPTMMPISVIPAATMSSMP